MAVGCRADERAAQRLHASILLHYLDLHGRAERFIPDLYYLAHHVLPAGEPFDP